MLQKLNVQLLEGVFIHTHSGHLWKHLITYYCNANWFVLFTVQHWNVALKLSLRPRECTGTGSTQVVWTVHFKLAPCTSPWRDLIGSNSPVKAELKQGNWHKSYFRRTFSCCFLREPMQARFLITPSLTSWHISNVNVHSHTMGSLFVPDKRDKRFLLYNNSFIPDYMYMMSMKERLPTSLVMPEVDTKITGNILNVSNCSIHPVINPVMRYECVWICVCVCVCVTRGCGSAA